MADQPVKEFWCGLSTNTDPLVLVGEFTVIGQAVARVLSMLKENGFTRLRDMTCLLVVQISHTSARSLDDACDRSLGARMVVVEITVIVYRIGTGVENGEERERHRVDHKLHNSYHKANLDVRCCFYCF